MVFSILICTLPVRSAMLGRLTGFLNRQIRESGLEGKVEILVDARDRKVPTGTKRNDLLRRASGDFSAFVDDDDWVSDTYVRDITSVVEVGGNSLHCVGFWGEVFFKKKRGGKMIHSVLCKAWTEEPGFYFRPPNHLNPVRTRIARKVPFRSIWISEDHFWSIEMCKRKILKNEVFLAGKPTYIYRCGSARKGL